MSLSFSASYGESGGFVTMSVTCFRTSSSRFAITVWNFIPLDVAFDLAKIASAWQNHSTGSALQNAVILREGKLLQPATNTHNKNKCST